MQAYLLDNNNEFPPVSETSSSGILAVGGELSASLLIAAYEHGVFPWYNPGEMIMWWSPEERGILPLDGLKKHKSMRNELNRKRYSVTYDTCFEKVIIECSNSLRGEQIGEEPETWIGNDMIKAYTDLHKLGIAHSVEVWKEAQLVGGLYGVSIGKMFFGESMFSKATNASKVGLFHLVERLKKWNFGPIDCQMMNSHIATLGAIPMSRDDFGLLLEKYIKAGETRKGNWTE
ncbi:MAG: leucyl/phenylalanyl-tRNA--protein transferase [Bacteroidetes bacterium]|nr:MAG: leucyl/phenylalanyl-tRNA--protein transferase [Bacteroidota bacterium]